MNETTCSLVVAERLRVQAEIGPVAKSCRKNWSWWLHDSAASSRQRECIWTQVKLSGGAVLMCASGKSCRPESRCPEPTVPDMYVWVLALMHVWCTSCLCKQVKTVPLLRKHNVCDLAVASDCILPRSEVCNKQALNRDIATVSVLQLIFVKAVAPLVPVLRVPDVFDLDADKAQVFI